MKFKKYTSIENSYRQADVDSVAHQGHDGGIWVVEEKLDGANFQLFCDGTKVVSASRNQIVDGTFFNSQCIIDEVAPSIMKWCKDRHLTLRIYGELFGEGIQRRIDYGKGRHFRVFDIAVGYHDEQMEHNERLVDVVNRNRIVRELGMSVVPELFIGTFEEALAYNPTFKSLLTPADKDGDNFAEGTVVRSYNPKFYNSGSRIIFKNKSEKFSEAKKNKTPKTVTSLDDEYKDLFEDVCRYVNKNRVLSVLSKEGEVTTKDFGRITGLVIVDALEDYTKDTGVDPKEAAGEVWKTFHKMLSREAANEVREEFKQIVS